MTNVGLILFGGRSLDYAQDKSGRNDIFFWIPAFAGMTGERGNNKRKQHKADSVRRLEHCGTGSGNLLQADI
jgi:hypothetical protein